MIGSDANAANNINNAAAIGSDAFVSASNCMVLGSINGVNGANTDSKVGIGVTNPDEKLTIGTGRLKFRAKDATMNGLVFTDSAGSSTKIQMGLSNNNLFALVNTTTASNLNTLIGTGQWGLNKIPNIGSITGSCRLNKVAAKIH
ncbi:MAG: hypothetical protein HWD58_10200 [Bacteroidota bacterium]|nr:MAG: hypothetical protein HWD58_10200 [Bacteroidota bacterium]